MFFLPFFIYSIRNLSNVCNLILRFFFSNFFFFKKKVGINKQKYKKKKRKNINKPYQIEISQIACILIVFVIFYISLNRKLSNK